MENNIDNLLDKAEDELYHHGVIGMKWGVRRYQTKDGSLTAAGKKRYNADMEKVKAETRKIKNQQRTDAKIGKLEAAKKKLEDLKKGKTAKAEEEAAKKAETDAQKRERILASPSAQEVYANRHLFSNKEMGDLYLRLNNEENIKRLIPQAVDEGKAKTDRFFDNVEDATKKAVTLSKAYNAAAAIVNAFTGTNSVSLPRIDLEGLNKTNKEVRKQEKKKIDEAKKAAKEEADKAKAAAKAEKEKQQREKDMADYHAFQDAYKKSLDPKPSSPYHNKGGETTEVTPKKPLALPSGTSSMSVSSLPSSSVDRGKSITNSSSSAFELLDVNGNTIKNYD